MKIENIIIGMKLKIVSGKATEQYFGWAGNMHKYMNTVQEVATIDAGSNGVWGVRFKNIGFWMWHPGDLKVVTIRKIEPVLFDVNELDIGDKSEN